MTLWETGAPEPGTLVRMTVRTGVYIGEVVECAGPRAVVKTLAVVRHPEQGDLHHPYDPDAVMFHERRALAYTEKTNVPLKDMEPYRGEVPDYKQSLLAAADAELRRLDRLARWAQRSMTLLEGLRREYER